MSSHKIVRPGRVSMKLETNSSCWIFWAFSLRARARSSKNHRFRKRLSTSPTGLLFARSIIQSQTIPTRRGLRLCGPRRTRSGSLPKSTRRNTTRRTYSRFSTSARDMMDTPKMQTRSRQARSQDKQSPETRSRKRITREEVARSKFWHMIPVCSRARTVLFIFLTKIHLDAGSAVHVA